MRYVDGGKMAAIHFETEDGQIACFRRHGDTITTTDWEGVTCKLCLRHHPESGHKVTYTRKISFKGTKEERENAKKCEKALDKCYNLLKQLDEERTGHKYKQYLKGYY